MGRDKRPRLSVIPLRAGWDRADRCRPCGQKKSARRAGMAEGNVEFWILNAALALASLEKTGAAVTGMAEGNFGLEESFARVSG